MLPCKYYQMMIMALFPLICLSYIISILKVQFLITQKKKKRIAKVSTKLKIGSLPTSTKMQKQKKKENPLISFQNCLAIMPLLLSMNACLQVIKVLIRAESFRTRIFYFRPYVVCFNRQMKKVYLSAKRESLFKS